MSIESGSSYESKEATAEAIIDRLNSGPKEILDLIAYEANNLGSPDFANDLQFCFDEIDNVEKRELTREVMGLIDDMQVTYENNNDPSTEFVETNSVIIRAKLRESAIQVAKSVLSRVGV